LIKNRKFGCQTQFVQYIPEERFSFNTWGDEKGLPGPGTVESPHGRPQFCSQLSRVE